MKVSVNDLLNLCNYSGKLELLGNAGKADDRVIVELNYSDNLLPNNSVDSVLLFALYSNATIEKFSFPKPGEPLQLHINSIGVRSENLLLYNFKQQVKYAKSGDIENAVNILENACTQFKQIDCFMCLELLKNIELKEN